MRSADWGRVYLSIDADFFNSNAAALLGMLDMLSGLAERLFIVLEHHHLLPHIRAHEFDTLVNLDWHSDIAGRNEQGKRYRLTDGSWVDHVPKAEQRRYIWLYPTRECLSFASGYCHEGWSPNPFVNRSRSGWGQIGKRKLCRPQSLMGLDVVAVGISISPNWLRPLTELALRLWAAVRNRRMRYGYGAKRWFNPVK